MSAGRSPRARSLNSGAPGRRQRGWRANFVNRDPQFRSIGAAMSKTTDFAAGLTHLGRASRIPDQPNAATLERVPNPHPDVDYVTRFAAPEFTSICPVTGQPDFAHLVIDYVPDRWLVESKSLKLHLASFRNHGAFHEDCTVRIGKELATLVAPRWLRIGGRWDPSGG